MARFLDSTGKGSVVAQIAWHVLTQAGPQLAGLDTVLTHRHEHGFVVLGLRQIEQSLVVGICGLASLLVGEVVAADSAIQPFETVQDQSIDRIAGSKRQLVVQTIIELGISLGVVLDPIGARISAACSGL